jgi:D-alanyl-lipoteichoic acid acyltransferase DltB (MBOAT superfamily)
VSRLSSIRHWIVQLDSIKSCSINLDFVRLQFFETSEIFVLRFQTFVEFLNKILEGPITYFTKVHDGEI